MRERIDILLVSMGLARSREIAKNMVKAGEVFVNGKQVEKASAGYETEGLRIEVKSVQPKYVSRGGYKLEKAVESFSLDLLGRTCIDIGASTGGFTDCMLQNGAAKVYAVDVGHDQLSEKFRENPMVIQRDNTNFRYATKEDFPERIDFISVDVSFISLTFILPPAFEILNDGGEMICLIKPQFEAGKDKVGKKGVVKERSVHKEVIGKIVGFARQTGFGVKGLDYSPIRGPEGNIEYLLYLIKGNHDVDLEENRDIIISTIQRAHQELE